MSAAEQRSIDRLVEGTRRFRWRACAADRQLFAELETGQSPHTLFITCADSRILPQLITDCGFGELFVIRNAGNLVPSTQGGTCGEHASIEFAIKTLSVENIIVCGHSNCGAMQALFRPPEEIAATLPSVARWIEIAEPTRLALADAALSAEEKVDAAIELNVLAQLDNLRQLPCVSEALTARRLALYGWVYQIGTAEVRGYDAALGRFVALNG